MASEMTPVFAKDAAPRMCFFFSRSMPESNSTSCCQFPLFFPCGYHDRKADRTMYLQLLALMCVYPPRTLLVPLSPRT